ncbi:MAG TPA: glycoside hydrolase family 88 protein [Croceibacterium sp.]
MAATGCATRGLLPHGVNPTAVDTGRRAVREWAGRAELMRYEVGDVTAVHYAEVATALGAARFAMATGDRELAAAVGERWMRARDLPNSANHVDANVVGVWPLLLGDPAGEGLALADGQWRERDETGLTRQARFWIDDIWMIGALQAEAWRRSAEPRFLDRAALTADAYLARLQQPSGLFHHGPEAPFFWGRGNGWVAAGLAEILSILPETHARRAAVLAGYHSMMAALLRHQQSSGLWNQLVDRPDAWAETSGSAMFAFAFLRGVNRGLLPATPYRAAAVRAWTALMTQTEPDGRLRGVCVGTGQSADAQYYLDRPVVTGDLHGQAALLWTAAELTTQPGG